MIPASQTALALSRHAACSLLLVVFGQGFAAAQRPSPAQDQTQPQYTYAPADNGNKPGAAHAQQPMSAEREGQDYDWVRELSPRNVTNWRASCANGGAPKAVAAENDITHSSDAPGRTCRAVLQRAADDGNDAILGFYKELLHIQNNAAAAMHIREIVSAVFAGKTSIPVSLNAKPYTLNIIPSLAFDAGFTHAFVDQWTPDKLTPDAITRELQRDTDDAGRAVHAVMRNASRSLIGDSGKFDSHNLESALENAENNNGALTNAAVAGMIYGAHSYQETLQGRSNASQYSSNLPPARQYEYTYASADPGNKAKTPPSVLRLCNGPNKLNDPRGCETWIWGDGHYDSVAIQHPAVIIAVESFTPDAMVFRLADAARPGKDGTLKAFMGKISPAGDSILEGISLAKDGTPGQFRAYWGAALEKRDAAPPRQTANGSAAVPLPSVMHFCAQHCSTFTLDNGRYMRTAGGANNGSFTVMTVEKFTPESVIIHRTDTGTFPGSNVYSGRMDSGNGGLSGQGWRLTWGAALNDLPGSDEERAARAGVSMNPQAQQNLGILQLLFGLFASDGPSDAPERDKRPSVGCAPGVVNPACYH